MTIAQQSGVPRWVLVPAALGAAFIVLPLVALATRVEWGDFFSLITSDSSRAALWLSLRTSAVSTFLSLKVWLQPAPPRTAVVSWSPSKNRKGVLMRASAGS